MKKEFLENFCILSGISMIITFIVMLFVPEFKINYQVMGVYIISNAFFAVINVLIDGKPA